MSFLFVPGTLVHEMAHFLTALFLLVPVGNLQLLPKIEENGVRLGSVSIAKTDPIRRFLIGIAPLFVGVGIIVGFFYFYPINRLISGGFWIVLFAVYLVFTVSNTMFSSKRDMEGVWGFLFIISSILIILWFLGISIDITNFLNKTSEVLKTSCLFMTIPIIIDVLYLLTLGKHGKA